MELSVLGAANERLTGWACQTNSSRKRRPTTAAAFCRVCSVTDVFMGSSRRSSWARLVDMRRAMAVLVRPAAFISCSICQASTSFRT